MSKSHHRGAGKAVLASLTGLALAGSMWTPALAVDNSSQGEATATGIQNQNQKRPDLKITQDLRTKQGPVSVFIQFEGKGAFEQTQPLEVRLEGADPVDKVAKVKSIRADIEAKAQEVTKAAAATHIYTTTNTIPGVAITGDAEAIREIAKRSDVVKISGIIPKTYENKGAVADTNALSSWVERDQTGKDVTIAVLDTGLDYTHADFGGPGTVEAFEKAQAAEATAPDPSLFDAEKYAGGWDLVGDDYDAGSAVAANRIPQPDANPLDCQSHGSHVAGSAAGYGVAADGTTFDGDYSTLTAEQVNDMKIGPGSAPDAKLVAIRVFGCEGSSSVVGQALDYVLDPNKDGDFSDRAQVVNMSLGSNFGLPDDPEVDIVNALTAQGVLSVVASGNDGDIYDVGGTPGSAASALTVANSVGSQVTLDRAEVLAPSGVAGSASGQYSANFDYTKATEEELNGTVVMAPAANKFGCDAFAADSLAGKWVWIQWEEGGAFPCGSKQRFDNAEAAGAEGVVLDSPRSVFESGIGGNATIPGIQFTNTFSDKLRPSAEDGTLEVQLDASYIATGTAETGALDTLNASSSRGVHGSNGVVKPDIAAPGTLIGSAAVGTGNGASVKSGTSMATPNVAGIAALVYGATTLNPYEVKSIVMNTATHDILTDDKIAYGPNRVGSGRVDAMQALETSVFAFAADNVELTSVNFGIVELGSKAVSITKNITIENKSETVRTYTAEYLAATTMPGVEVTVGSAKDGSATILVPGNASTTAVVTLTIADPTALAKTIDPAAEKTQLGVPRQYLADVSGRVQFTSEGVPALRVPVYSAPQPTSEMSAGAKVTFDPNADSVPVTFKGRDLNQGEGSTAYLSKVSPLVLGAESPRSESLSLDSLHQLDLRAVGAASTVPAIAAAEGDVNDGLFNVGISTWQNWNSLGENSYVTVEIETTGDDKADFSATTTRIAGLDMSVFEVVKLKEDGSSEPVEGSLNFVNNFAGDVDTNTFDTNVVTMPIYASALGLDLTKSQDISYRVITEHPLNVDDEGNNVPIDATDWIGFNLTQPAMWFEGAEGSSESTLFADLNASTLLVHRSADDVAGKLLFLHHHNAEGVKDEIVVAEDGKLRFSDVPDSLKFSQNINWMADEGLTTGYPDGTYRPFGTVNRDAMAAFMYRLAGEPAFDAPTTSPFTDITLDTKFYKEMAWMEATGLSDGYPNGTYRPLAPVNRDAMAAFMNRFAAEICSIDAAADYEAPNTKPFTDVEVNNLFQREISWMKETGVSTGYPDGSYHPVESVKRDAMAAFINRLVDDVTGDCGGR
ncbi:S8 family serine peptidase [Arthrobacter roseus]|uniref:S8 family serine peptidase n=1 Tax=Arthrobacter roseus TaxID=136274 RepID=UPI001963E207|nr:S8 family serine peptidase [Arthrobacter roseus]MBM7847531.1 subtilisin family serine protease [Arthrobacter roseus]